MMLKKIAIVAGLGLALSAAAEAQTPRKGGVIRMTAPYGSSFTSMDIHTTQRAQDEIYAKGLHRSLYIWDAAEGKPVPELAREVTVSGGGLVHTFKLRDDAYFHHGRRMTADDIIWSYNRIMDGTKAYPGARFVRVIEGAAAVEKGEAKEISGLKKIDDFTLEMKLTEKVDPGFYFFTALTSIYPADEAAKEGFIQKPIGLGPFKFVEHVPGSRVVLERFDKFYKPGKPYADKLIVSLMGEAAARDVAFRNKEIDTSVLGPAQYVAYQADPGLKGTIVEVAEVFTRYMGIQTVHRQAGSAGHQPCDRYRSDHQQTGERQSLPRHELAAADLPALRQDHEALRLRSREGEAVARGRGLSHGLRIRMDREPE